MKFKDLELGNIFYLPEQDNRDHYFQKKNHSDTVNNTIVHDSKTGIIKKFITLDKDREVVMICSPTPDDYKACHSIGGGSNTLHYMNWAEAYNAMKSGSKIKLPEWLGYWYWDYNKTIMIHTRDDEEFCFFDTKRRDFTLDFTARTDWIIA
jgi:hypothetical protein